MSTWTIVAWALSLTASFCIGYLVRRGFERENEQRFIEALASAYDCLRYSIEAHKLWNADVPVALTLTLDTIVKILREYNGR